MARAVGIARPERKNTRNFERQSKEPPESMFLQLLAFTLDIPIFKNEFRRKGGIRWDFLPSDAVAAASMICCCWRRSRQSFIQLIEERNELIRII
jgi:hypothetical protein